MQQLSKVFNLIFNYEDPAIAGSFLFTFPAFMDILPRNNGIAQRLSLTIEIDSLRIRR